MLKSYFTRIAIVNLITYITCGVLFSFHITLLLMWVVALFNTSIRLRRKVKYSLLANYNQDTCLEALNSKVEYRKSLFMFAIVLCELISSILTVVKVFENLIFYASSYYDKPISTNNSRSDISKHVDTHSESNNSKCNISLNNEWGHWGVYNDIILTQVGSVCFGISFILTFSLVYTLMSYYVMVTKKSLNYNLSLKSVDLAREQKVLLLVSSVMCLILLVLLVRAEVFVVYQIVANFFAIFQCFIINYYL